MKRNEILKELMRQQGISTAEMSRETGISYTTLKSIFDNGVEKSSYSSICSICSICSALGITTDQLENRAGRFPGNQGQSLGFSLEIGDFSEKEMEQLRHYISYLRFLRKQE